MIADSRNKIATGPMAGGYFILLVFDYLWVAVYANANKCGANSLSRAINKHVQKGKKLSHLLSH